jgi:hypothetical protein
MLMDAEKQDFPSGANSSKLSYTNVSLEKHQKFMLESL